MMVRERGGVSSTDCEAATESSDGLFPGLGKVLEDDKSSHYGSSVFEGFDPDGEEGLPAV